MGKENSLLFLLVLLLSISITIVLDLGLKNWRNSVSISSLDLSVYLLLNWISVSVNCSSSIFLAIYNSLAIVLVGSRKALRSRLGFLVSGSWDPNLQFTFCFLLSMFIYFSAIRSDPIPIPFYFSVWCNLTFPCLITANPRPNPLYISSNLHSLHFKIPQFTFLAL